MNKCCSLQANRSNFGSVAITPDATCGDLCKFMKWKTFCERSRTKSNNETFQRL